MHLVGAINANTDSKCTENNFKNYATSLIYTPI